MEVPKNKMIAKNQQLLPKGLILLILCLITACTSGGSQTTDPTATPSTRTELAIQVETQSKDLMLRLTSPSINMVTELTQVNVAGVASPDATLSVNGHLVSQDPEGLFSIDMDFPNPSIPMVIEVIASSITGETKSEIRPVISYGGSVQSGLFGTVSSVNPSNIILNTTSGIVSLSVDAKTSIALHGWESPSISDINTGTLVGVTMQGSRAKSILAVPIRPVLTRHFTGVVAASTKSSSSAMGEIALADSSKHRITANTTNEIPEAAIGSLVTAVLKQDFPSGDLKATAIDSALNGAARIVDALAMNQKIDSDQAEENITALRWRLEEHGVRHVSMLLDQQAHEGSDDRLAAAEKTYARPFSEHHIGTPSADVTGLITSIATSLGTSSTKLITIQPASGESIMLKLLENTSIALSGDRVKSAELDLASRITVRYSIDGNVANQVTVLPGNTISLESSAQLAAIAAQGEVQGLLMDVIDSELIVSILSDRETGQRISLRSEGSLIFSNGTPVELDSSLEGTTVFAWFDPSTYQLLEMESLNLSLGEYFVSGVVHSFIPKFADGNLTIRTIDGQMRALTHHSDTVIRRNGLRVSIQDIRAGDLVRPNTKIRTSDGIDEILFLSLKTPAPGRTSGFIRGLMHGPEGQVQITVSNIWLDLISLEVNSSTQISQHGQAVRMQDIKVGQAVNLATYDPLTFETVSLALNPLIMSDRASK